MQLSLDVHPELAANLAKLARAKGIEVPAYAVALIEEALETADKRMKFERFLEKIKLQSPRILPLPEEAFSRESIYQDDGR